MNRKDLLKLIEILKADNHLLRNSGCEMAKSALEVIQNYDGIHRLALSVSKWAKAIADESGRGKTKKKKG